LLGVLCAYAAVAIRLATMEATSHNNVVAANWRIVILFIRIYSLAWKP